jgi:hypothetical protein
MTLRRATLLVGSPRPRGTSTSEALGRYLLGRLGRSGVAIDVLFLAAMRRVHVDTKVAPAVSASDLVVLASPVYVDRRRPSRRRSSASPRSERTGRTAIPFASSRS